MMGSQPAQQDIFGALNDLCTNMTVDVEARLATQKEKDAAEMKRLAEEEMRRVENARLVAEQEAKEKAERSLRLEQERQEIEAVERALEVKREALRIAQKAAYDDNGMDLDDDEDQASKSATEVQMVSPILHVLYLMLTKCITILGVYEEDQA
jgi:hypothetical protein